MKNKAKKGEMEYVYATAGSDQLKDFTDVNIPQALGIESTEQYRISTDNAKKISENLGGNKLTFTGHSLGGGLAAANAKATGSDAYTFNASAVHPNTIQDLKLFHNAKIDAFVVEGEIVDESQRILLTLTANGTKHKLNAEYDFLSPTVLAFIPPLTAVEANIAYNLYQRTMNHLMGAVITKMKSQVLK